MPRNVLREYAISTGVGALYGATNTIVGHPFDTVKTKMQALSELLKSVHHTLQVAAPHPLVLIHAFTTRILLFQAQSGFGTAGNMETVRMIHASSGVRGLYHGCIPPLWGSVVYRSTQFAVYDSIHAALASTPAMRQRVLPASDMEARVVVAGFAGASARTLLESPIEYAKVQGQTGQQWRWSGLYQGARLQWARTAPTMTKADSHPDPRPTLTKVPGCNGHARLR